MKQILTFALLLVVTHLEASSLFVVKKNKNPKNILHYKANIQNCKFIAPAIKAYWIMGEEGGHVEGLTSLEKRHFSPTVSYHRDSEVEFTFGALDLVTRDLSSRNIQVKLVNCVAKAFVEINNKEIELNEIYVDGRISIRGWDTNYMIVKGKHNGAKFEHKIQP